jgi:CheY-like chemotaxis protein/two-component sensor histidine kinase
VEDALREGDRRKDEFLATLAHELRNPLAPIRQAAKIADSDRASEAQRRWGYSVIERQVQHMSLLLDDLFDVSRITRGTLSLRKRSVDLRDAVSGAVEVARPLIDSHHHQLIVETPHALVLDADPLRLSQILANLLTNAAKYTPPGGTIRLIAERHERTAMIRVEDTGIGLREEDMPRIFQMFSQATSHEHSQGGLGIGLALTKGLVEMHRGTIEASSAGPGKGSVFIVRLPLGERISAASERAGVEPEPRSVLSRRVLIADDNRDAAESLAILLRFEGHDVVVACDGNAALRLFEAHAPDVAVLDIGMPLLDGYEVARRIRASANGAQVLLVAVTGWGQEKDRRETREAGFDHHLTKPVEPEAVSQLIQPKGRDTAARPGTPITI